MKLIKIKLNRNDIIYPELSYKIIGILFDVFNTLGYGYQEKYYQKALSIALERASLSFQEQIYTPLYYGMKKIGNYYLDFLIENKIVLEIKRGNYFSKNNIEQILSYLKATGLKLGILANFTEKGIKYKRILNIK